MKTHVLTDDGVYGIPLRAFVGEEVGQPFED